MTKRQFILTAIGAVLFAFVLREWHILVSVLPDHTQGDVASYLRYALHMAWDGVFSQAGNGEPVVPDAYRSPGYPVFLLGVLKLSGLQAWYSAVYHAQAVIGALTVGGVIALARQWLPYHWALLAGAFFSLWPHHIAATNAMLIEVVFGFVIVIALLLATVALSRRSLVWCVAAGATFGYAYLVNPVIALFPVALLVVFWRAQQTKLGITILLVSLIAVVGWGVRNTAQGAAGDGRAWQNLVQGAWPGYHHAEKWWPSNAADREIRAMIKSEMNTIMDDHARGLRRVGTRLASDPITYAAWYLIQKPYLL
jgi:4-amino-4-deoxy-L-arabinose transferase-like glycosyltransferase